MFQTQMRKTQTNMLLTEPARLWLLSTRYHREGKRRKARLIKAYLFLFFVPLSHRKQFLRGFHLSVILR